MTLFCVVYGFIYAFVTPFLLPMIAIPVVVLMAGVVWALPDSKSPPTKAMEVLFFAVATALVVWPNYLALSLPGLPWITLLRVTGFPFAFLLMVCASTSTEFRERTVAAVKSAPIIGVFMLSFVLIQFLSIAISNAMGDSIGKFVLNQIYWTFVFFAGCYLFLKPGLANRWATLLWILAIPLGLIALAEHHLKHVLWAGHIPAFLKIEDPNVDRIMQGRFRLYTNIYRSQATFSTPLGLSEYLSLTIPFIVHYFLISKRNIVRIAAAISVPYILLSIIISGSRLGLVGFGVSMLMYGLVWGILRWRRNRGDLIGPAVVLSYPAILAAVVGASFLFGRIRHQVWGGAAEQASTNGRFDQWSMGIPKILSHPFGFGIGRGATALGFFAPDGELTIDSYYLLILMDYGFIGFIVFYGLIISSIFYSTKWAILAEDGDAELALLTPLGISITSFLVMKAVFSNTDSHTLIFMMMGMICALVFRARRHLGVDERAPLSRRSDFDQALPST